MKLKWQIYILSTLIFVLCAIAFGLLHYDMRYEQSKLSYKNKISALVVSVGALAKSSSSFVCEENIAKLKERAELETLEVYKMQAKHRVVLKENPEIIEGNDSLSATYTAGSFIVKASVVEADSIDLKESFWLIITYWISAGVLIAFIAAFLIFSFLESKIRLLEQKLFDETSSKIEILEFKDLMFSAKLLKESNKLKKEKEYYKLQNKENSTDALSSILQKLYGNKSTSFGKYKVSFEIANKTPLNSFFAKISQDYILYGNINSKSPALESLSECILIKDYAIKLLETQDPAQCYAKLSKIFDIENFKLIKLEANSLIQLSFDKDSLKKEELNFDKSILLSTQKDNKEISLYTKLNFENNENKLNFILKLLPKNAGGLYILIEA